MLDIDVDSIMSQLKNKVSYRLKETIEGIVNDPEANQYAKEKAESKSSTGTVEGLNEMSSISGILSKASGKSSSGDISDRVSTADIPDSLTNADVRENLSAAEKMLRKIKQIALRVKDRMINIFITFIIPLILAMFVANESIMYPAPVRIIYFIFAFVLCYVSQTAVALLGTVYLGKFVYDYYVNKMEKRGIPLIVPPILAVLPVKVFDPSTPAAFFKDLFNFPLTYPRNERGNKNLLLIMDDYLESLKASFTYLDNVKSMPMFVEKLKKIDENMEQLHKLIPELVEKNEENKNENKPPASLPPSISKQNNKNSSSLNESTQEDKKGPVPMTIAERREQNGLPQINSLVQENKTKSISPTVSQKETPANNSSTPPNYNNNGKATPVNSAPPPSYNAKEQPPANNSSAPSNYNGKEQTVSMNSSPPPSYNNNAKTTVNSAPPAYDSVPNKGNQSQPKTPKSNKE